MEVAEPEQQGEVQAEMELPEEQCEAEAEADKMYFSRLPDERFERFEHLLEMLSAETAFHTSAHDSLSSYIDRHDTRRTIYNNMHQMLDRCAPSTSNKGCYTVC